jgi:hypothetical protein
VEAVAQNVENSAIDWLGRTNLVLGFRGLQFAFVDDIRNRMRVVERTMGHREVAEEHSNTQSQSASHPSFNRAFPPAPNHVVDRLVRLKDSDPEMFSEAWNRLPDSTRENILQYLKKYPNLLEKEYPLLLLHRAGKLSGDEVEEFEEQASTSPGYPEPLEEVAPREQLQQKQPVRRARPRHAKAKASARLRTEAPSGESAFKPSPKVVRNNRAVAHNGGRGRADSQFLEEIRKITKQNSIQIELLQRLLQAYEDQD